VRFGLALFVICAAQVIFVLDATVVNVAIPTIHHSLHFSLSNLQWLLTAYSLTYGGFLLLGGRSGDIFGQRRMFMIGVAAFTFASLLGGLAQNDTWLIVTRGLQGVGGAIASPTALALIVTNFPEGRERTRSVAAYSAMSGAGGAVGLLLGGLLTDYVSWRWIFLVNVPIGAIVLLLAPRALSESGTRAGRLELPGALTVTAAMLFLIYGISGSSVHGWGSARTIVALCLAAVLVVVFVVLESRSDAPLIPLSIFASRNRRGAYIVMFFVGAVGSAMFFFLSQFTQNVLGFSPVKTGVGFVPAAVGVVIITNVVARVIGKTGARPLLIAGPAGLSLSMLLMSRLTPTDRYGQIIVPLMIWSLSMGILFIPINLSVLAGVRPQEAGLASGLLNAGQQLGGALGLSVLATIAATATSNSLRHHASTPVAFTHGYTTGFAVGAAIAAAAFVAALVISRRPSEPRGPAPADTLTELPPANGPADELAALSAALPVDEA
jgi:EmrB/QacA subfamily drug resistance transporter